ncbi:DUF6233 domain-containing protein [Streptomyces celluloflavus]|uniref:DUF6233 domain-containing protein n=1 Tax=Streptomyces celluloflavus TaxID=58344 RepID=UPI0037AD35B2
MQVILTVHEFRRLDRATDLLVTVEDLRKAGIALEFLSGPSPACTTPATGTARAPSSSASSPPCPAPNAPNPGEDPGRPGIRPPTRPHRRPAALARRIITFCAPHPVVQPLPGQDYTSLDPPPPQERRRWRLDIAPKGSWCEFFVHRLDCARGQGDYLVTDQEALEKLADPDTANACPICRPDAVLRRL